MARTWIISFLVASVALASHVKKVQKGDELKTTRRGFRFCGQQRLQNLPCRRVDELLQESALQEHRIGQGAGGEDGLRRVPWSGAEARGGARREDDYPAGVFADAAEAGAGHVPGVPRARSGAGQHPAIGAYAERRGVHELPLHPPLAPPEIPAGEEAERTLL